MESETVKLKVWVTLKDARVDDTIEVIVPAGFTAQERNDLFHDAAFQWIHGHVAINMQEIK